MFFKLNKVILAFFLFLLVCPAFSQETDYDDPDWFWDREISKITFENLVNVKNSEASGVTSNYIGRIFTEELYAEITDRLYAMDVFEEISPYARPDPRNEGKINIVFSVVERPVIKNINFSGNRKVRSGELRDTINIKVKDIYIESHVLIDERAIRDFYLEKGYTGVRVSNSVEMSDDGVDVTFVVDEGMNTVVSSILFQGNTVFSERTLRSKLSLKQTNFFRESGFQRSSLEADKKTIVEYYGERGYADAVVVDVVEDVVANPDKDRNEMTLTFIIQEGVQYTLGDIVIQGNSIFSTDRLRSLIKLNTGAVFNLTKLQEGMQAIVDLYAANGYMTNQFFPNMQRDAERRTVDYTLTIYETSRSHIENIIIKGNTKTKDYVITRELGIHEGDAFSRETLMDGLRNLYNLRYFSNIVPEPTQGSDENLVDLVISLEEQPTNSIQFGLTFSGVTRTDEFPVSLFGGWENTNFRGEGRSLSANVSVATSSQSIGASYGQNWIKDLPISWSESLTLSHSENEGVYNYFTGNGILVDDNYYFRYQNWSATLGSSLGRRWQPTFAILTLSGGLNNSLLSHQYNDTMYVPVDPSLSRYTNRAGLMNSIWAQISLDDRDVNFDPSKGWFASQRLAWYGIIPGLEKEFFLRSDTKLEGYLTLFDVPVTKSWNFKMVLAAYSGLSLLFPVTGYPISNSNRVYINGMFDGRGWTDLYNKSRGYSLFSNRLELRVPVVPSVLGVGAFFDAAAVKSTADEMFSDLQLEDFYFSLGPGVRFLLPQFPLHLLLSNNFKYTNGNFAWYELFKFVLSFNITNR